MKTFVGIIIIQGGCFPWLLEKGLSEVGGECDSPLGFCQSGRLIYFLGPMSCPKILVGPGDLYHDLVRRGCNILRLLMSVISLGYDGIPLSQLLSVPTPFQARRHCFPFSLSRNFSHSLANQRSLSYTRMGPTIGLDLPVLPHFPMFLFSLTTFN